MAWLLLPPCHLWQWTSVSGNAELVGLTVAGQAILVSNPNLSISLPGGISVIINQQTSSSGGTSGSMTVNALHVTGRASTWWWPPHSPISPARNHLSFARPPEKASTPVSLRHSLRSFEPLEPRLTRPWLRYLRRGSSVGISAEPELRLVRRRPAPAPHTRQLPGLASNCPSKKGQENVANSCQWKPDGRRGRDCIAEVHAANS
jgi:hypothetical protein